MHFADGIKNGVTFHVTPFYLMFPCKTVQKITEITFLQVPSDGHIRQRRALPSAAGLSSDSRP